MRHDEDLVRIAAALDAAASVLERYTPGEVAHRVKSGDDPVTAADLEINAALERCLPRPGEGWLSEETADDPARLDCERVWVVDPLDGTREFVQGIPEWCVSVGLVAGGVAVAGGILAPAAGLTVIGAAGHGVTCNGAASRVRDHRALEGLEILASRSEVGRGQWDHHRQAPFRVRAMGSVALKLALVAAGRAAATWTLVPKHEWDVAGGAALVRAAGGKVWTPEGDEPRFNRQEPKLTGLLAAPAGLEPAIRAYLGAASA